MTTFMNDFSYDQPMILDGSPPDTNASKSKSKLERAFKKIRKVLTPKAKRQLDECEFDSRTARHAAEVTLEAEGRKGKSIKRKLLEGCDPFSRLKRRRRCENAMDTSSDSPLLAVQDGVTPLTREELDGGYDNDVDMIPELEAALCLDVEMAFEDPAVSALADLMAGLSISDPLAATDHVASGAPLPILEPTKEALKLDVEPKQPVPLDTPGFNTSTATLVDRPFYRRSTSSDSTLVSSHHGGSLSASFASFLSQTLGKATGSVDKKKAPYKVGKKKASHKLSLRG